MMMPLQNKYKETNNKYFENLSEKLNEKGVRNNEFVLKLYNENINGLNPHCRDFLLEQKVLRDIQDETESNLWYYLRECVKIRDRENKLHDFNLNIINLESLFLLEHGADVYLTSPRATMGTMTMCAYLLWKAHTGKKISFVCTRKSDEHNMFDRIKEIITTPFFIDKGIAISSYINYKLILDYNIDADYLFIDDFEHMNNSTINDIFKILKLKKEGKIKTQIIFKSCLGRESSLGRRVADDIAKSSSKFEYFYFDYPELIENKLYYVQEDIYDLFNKDTAEEKIENFKRLFNNDEETINNELYCNRCKKYEIRL